MAAALQASAPLIITKDVQISLGSAEPTIVSSLGKTLYINFPGDSVNQVFVASFILNSSRHRVHGAINFIGKVTLAKEADDLASPDYGEPLEEVTKKLFHRPLSMAERRARSWIKLGVMFQESTKSLSGKDLRCFVVVYLLSSNHQHVLEYRIPVRIYKRDDGDLPVGLAVQDAEFKLFIINRVLKKDFPSYLGERYLKPAASKPMTAPLRPTTAARPKKAVQGKEEATQVKPNPKKQASAQPRQPAELKSTKPNEYDNLDEDELNKIHLQLLQRHHGIAEELKRQYAEGQREVCQKIDEVKKGQAENKAEIARVEKQRVADNADAESKITSIQTEAKIFKNELTSLDAKMLQKSEAARENRKQRHEQLYEQLQRRLRMQGIVDHEGEGRADDDEGDFEDDGEDEGGDEEDEGGDEEDEGGDEEDEGGDEEDEGGDEEGEESFGDEEETEDEVAFRLPTIRYASSEEEDDGDRNDDIDDNDELEPSTCRLTDSMEY